MGALERTMHLSILPLLEFQRFLWLVAEFQFTIFATKPRKLSRFTQVLVQTMCEFVRMVFQTFT